MKKLLPILAVNGSDGTGASGIQADIRAIMAMGGYPLTALTTVTVQDSAGIVGFSDFEDALLLQQVDALMQDFSPKAVKVGLVRRAGVMRALRDRLVGCRHIVCAPGIVDAHGQSLMSDEAVQAYQRHLLPEAELLVLKCAGAERMTGLRIHDEATMLQAANQLLDMGPRAVFLRGGHCSEGLVTGLLLSSDDTGHPCFYTSPNTEGWQLHGVGGTLSSAIAARLAMGDAVVEAVSQAHQYLRSQVVYSAESVSHSYRQVELYNRLMEQVTQHYARQRDVAFYAAQLNVTPRYLSEVTARVAGKTPKQLIADYLMTEIEHRLQNRSLTIQEVARDVGFASQAAFAQFFRSQRGCSPSEFRERR